jgi:hypothetical protein
MVTKSRLSTQMSGLFSDQWSDRLLWKPFLSKDYQGWSTQPTWFHELFARFTKASAQNPPKIRPKSASKAHPNPFCLSPHDACHCLQTPASYSPWSIVVVGVSILRRRRQAGSLSLLQKSPTSCLSPHDACHCLQTPASFSPWSIVVTGVSSVRRRRRACTCTNLPLAVSRRTMLATVCKHQHRTRHGRLW